MNIKLGLAAAVLASVGSFAVAEGAGDGGCGDGDCDVGTDLHFDTYPAPIPGAFFAGHGEFIIINSRTGDETPQAFSGIATSYGTIGNQGSDSGDGWNFYRTGNCSESFGHVDNGCNVND